MANVLYDAYRQTALEGGIAVLTDDIKTVLLDANFYTPDPATDDFLDDISGSARIATSANMTSKTTTDGTFDADDVTYVAVAAGDPGSYLTGYRDTGVEATSNLMWFIDTATGLPVTPNGSDITITWNAAGIYIL